MPEELWIAFAASFAAGLATTSGITVIRRYEGWARRNSIYFACFAAGVLISASFLHIVPQAMEMTPKAPVYVLAGYFLMHAFNRFVVVHVCDKPYAADYALGLLPLIGIGFHSFLDGIVYSVSFSTSMLTGVLVAAGMVLHEFPEGIIMYALLVRSGFPSRKSFWLAFLSAAATTPAGTLVSLPFMGSLEPALLGTLLAISAGSLIYVGATHLLPQAEQEGRRFSLIAIGAGVAVAAGIVLANG